jgi:hypothetical protein
VAASRIRGFFFSQFTFLFLGLAFCVFGWGLQYKLSLYDPPQAVSHEIPQAKLISKDEQALTNENLLVKKASAPDTVVQTTFPAIFFAVFLALVAPLGLVRYGKYSRADQPVRPISHASLSAFFFRPPPVLA